MSDYTADPTNNPTTYDLPDDGELKPVASVNPTLEALADAVAHANWPEQNSTKRYQVASQFFARTVRNPFMADPTKWTALFGGGMIQSAGVPTVSGGAQAIDLPDGAVLSQVTIYIDPFGGGAGHAGLPATMPKVSVYRHVVATGVDTLLATATDGSASVAAYEAIHSIVAALGSTETVDNVNNTYSIVFDSEGGANSLNGLTVVGCKVTYTVTNIDPGN